MHIQLGCNLEACFVFALSWLGLCYMLDAMVEGDEFLVEFIGNVGGVEKNCGMSSTSIVHGNISNVENMHMQAATTNYSLCSCKFYF